MVHKMYTMDLWMVFILIIFVWLISIFAILTMKKIMKMQEEIDCLRKMSNHYYEDIGKIEKELRDNKKIKQKEDKKRKRDKLK